MNNTMVRFITILLLVAIILSACGESQPVVVQDGGDIISQELDLSDFEEIEVKDMFKVDIEEGGAFLGDGLKE